MKNQKVLSIAIEYEDHIWHLDNPELTQLWWDGINEAQSYQQIREGSKGEIWGSLKDFPFEKAKIIPLDKSQNMRMSVGVSGYSGTMNSFPPAYKDIQYEGDVLTGENHKGKILIK